MALNIISNFAANVATRNLARTDAQVTASLAKLSSGTRVVSAKDDAASLAIGSRLRAEVAGLKQASVNAGQASSLLQIADGAYSTISDILVRTKALAVQSASGQLSSTERTVLDAEFQALKNEITRISNDTEFNGTALIQGDSGNTTNNNNTLTARGVTDVKFDFDTFGVDGFAYRVEFAQATDTFTLTALDSNAAADDGSGPATVNFILTAAQKVTQAALTGAQTMDVAIGSSGITVVLDRFFSTTTDLNAVSADNTSGDISVVTATLLNTTTDLIVTAADITSLTGLSAYDATTGDLTINLTSTGVAGTIDLNAVAGIEFNALGANVTLAAQTTATATIDIKINGNIIATLDLTAITSGTATAAGGSIKVNIGQGLVSNTTEANGAATAFTFQIGTGTTSGVDTVDFSIDGSSSTALGIVSNDILDVAKALLSITAVGTAIDSINSFRANVGASQNRLDFASANLSASIENAEAARSQLLDLDIASEITNFTSKQVLLQAGVAMLAQANQLPQNLLRLLQ